MCFIIFSIIIITYFNGMDKVAPHWSLHLLTFVIQHRHMLFWWKH